MSEKKSQKTATNIYNQVHKSYIHISAIRTDSFSEWSLINMYYFSSFIAFIVK